MAVGAVQVHQLVVSALLDDLTILQHADKVGVANGTQPVRYHQRGAVLHQLLQRLLHQLLRFGIQCRGSLVQNQYRRVLQYGAGYGYTLPLPAAQPAAAVADQRLVAIRRRHDELVRIGYTRSTLNRLLPAATARSRLTGIYTKGDVVIECVVE